MNIVALSNYWLDSWRGVWTPIGETAESPGYGNGNSTTTQQTSTSGSMAVLADIGTGVSDLEYYSSSSVLLPPAMDEHAAAPRSGPSQFYYRAQLAC